MFVKSHQFHEKSPSHFVNDRRSSAVRSDIDYQCPALEN